MCQELRVSNHVLQYISVLTDLTSITIIALAWWSLARLWMNLWTPQSAINSRISRVMRSEFWTTLCSANSYANPLHPLFLLTERAQMGYSLSWSQNAWHYVWYCFGGGWCEADGMTLTCSTYFTWARICHWIGLASLSRRYAHARCLKIPWEKKDMFVHCCHKHFGPRWSCLLRHANQRYGW